ncbi:MAG: hypothetical protein KatS3mg099_173 [Candidatus Parcubacteria bacterium]|nr:MAG: hypothetical protein KatS3mg099_173 [Candidatus Parcubacteria bacterium]
MVELCGVLGAEEDTFLSFLLPALRVVPVATPVRGSIPHFLLIHKALPGAL